MNGQGATRDRRASFWLAYLRRALVQNGQLSQLLVRGIEGIATDPQVTAMMVRNGSDYDALLQQLLGRGWPDAMVCDALLLDDVRRAADTLQPVFIATDGRDGYVTMPLDPALAHDSEALVASGYRYRALWKRFNWPNSMLALPATPAGVRALRALVAQGCHTSIGPLFSPAQYREIATAYRTGLEQFFGNHVIGQPPAGVATFCLASLDKEADFRLQQLGRAELHGSTAITLARSAYAAYEEIFRGPPWEPLAKQGGRPQRLLWQDTMPYGATYPRTWYVDALLDTDAVCALSLSTLQAVQASHEHSRPVPAEGARPLGALEETGIDLDALACRLQADRLQSAAIAYERLLGSVRQKRKQMAKG